MGGVAQAPTSTLCFAFAPPLCATMPAMSDDETWLPLREGRERRDLRALELVLTARGIDSRIDWQDGIWRLQVALDDEAAAIRELATYERENVPSPAPPMPARIDSGWWGVAGYLLCLWLVMALTTTGAFGWDWRAAGRLHVASVAQGDLWRLATALTLHADAGHIVANSVFGAFFGLLAGRHLGSGLAWFCIVLGGIAGNALGTLLRPSHFASLGASTATFAAVGLVGAFMWRSGYFARATRRGLGWQRASAPLFAAVALFAFTGIGEDNTDVLAHFTGLIAGLAIGVAVARSRLQFAGARAQRFFGLTAAAIVLAAWLLAG